MKIRTCKDIQLLACRRWFFSSSPLIPIKIMTKNVYNKFVFNFGLLDHCATPTEPQQLVGYARDTHTQTHTHVRSLVLTHTRASTRTHSRSYTHTHTHMHSCSHSYSHTHTHSHTHSQIYSPSWSPTQNESKAESGRARERAESTDNTSELERETRHNDGQRERTTAMRASE